MKIVCMSDTHGYVGGQDFEVPDGDVLVHAGDATRLGEPNEVFSFLAWFRRMPHKHKIFVAGNHDRLFEQRDLVASVNELRSYGITYLQDSRTIIDGVRFWGAPWTQEFGGWAFGLKPGPQIDDKWALIPDRTDVLITHSPAAGVRDRDATGRSLGCMNLARRLSSAGNLRPQAFIFGHIHEGYGTSDDGWPRCVNASVCNRAYEPVNPVQSFEYLESKENDDGA
ncbi:MAG: metallophosphatase domain-containing protein [Acidimicrobiales bacterium]